MVDVEQLVEKYRQKLLIDQEIENYKREVVNPLADKVFFENFANIFSDLVSKINEKLGFKVVSYQQEGKHRFTIEGQFHRIYFQKSKVDYSDKIAGVYIIPIYVWKGVTKHLGPISYFINTDSKEVKWDITYETVEEYSNILFSRLVDDEDFFM